MSSITASNSFTLNLYNTSVSPVDFSLFQLGAVSGIPSDIVVTEQGSASYDAILQSQNGAVYLMTGLTFQVNQYPDVDSQQRQILEPFRFRKKDANGDDYELQKVQVVDPYQKQFTYSFVDLMDMEDKFVLDGYTQFKYRLLGLTGVNITFNYVEATNENFGTLEGEEIKSKEFDTINQLRSASEFSGESELIVKDNAVVTKKNKRSINWLFWILGASAVYLFINPFKTNQK